ncbi:MAG TPA: YdcF family protein [Methylomirabilota bacterium]|nr:YdcF family protein [Methylomirabilota bacterium]
MGSRVDRVSRLVGLIGVVGFLVTAFTPLAHRLNLATAVPAELVPSDAIVVLGAWVSPSGTLSSESLRRTNHGIALYRRGLAPTLVLLGGSASGGPSEADARAEQARLHGVPAQAIMTETRVRTTREEAARVKELLQSKGARTILLVTNAGHLARARPLFERAGFQVHPAPSDSFVESSSPESRLELMRVLVREFFGWLFYRVAGYI